MYINTEKNWVKKEKPRVFKKVIVNKIRRFELVKALCTLRNPLKKEIRVNCFVFKVSSKKKCTKTKFKIASNVARIKGVDKENQATILLSDKKPPINGPKINPNANAIPTSAKFLGLSSDELTSLIEENKTERLPPKKPGIILDKKRRNKLL